MITLFKNLFKRKELIPIIYSHIKLPPSNLRQTKIISRFIINKFNPFDDILIQCVFDNISNRYFLLRYYYMAEYLINNSKFELYNNFDFGYLGEIDLKSNKIIIIQENNDIMSKNVKRYIQESYQKCMINSLFI